MAYSGMGGGPDSGPGGMGAVGGNVNGGNQGGSGGGVAAGTGSSGPPGRDYGGMNMDGPASAPDVDPDVHAAISGAIAANVGAHNAGTNLGNPTGGFGLGFEDAGPNPASLSTQQLGQNVTVGYVDPAQARANRDREFARNLALAWARANSIMAEYSNSNSTNETSPTSLPSAPSAPVDTFDADLANTTGATQPGGLGPNPTMGLQMEARDFRGVITGFLDSVKNKPQNQQEREVQAFLDNPRNQMNLRNLSIDYANNIDDEMGFGRFTPGLGTLHGMRNMTMKGLRAMGLEPGINTPEMDALESLASRLGVSIDSRSGGIAEMPGYRWDEETGTYKKITEL